MENFENKGVDLRSESVFFLDPDPVNVDPVNVTPDPKPWRWDGPRMRVFDGEERGEGKGSFIELLEH